MSSPLAFPSPSKRFADFTGHGIHWGAATAAERGPVIASLTAPLRRNAIGAHAGAGAVYRALALATGALPRDRATDPDEAAPATAIGPHPQWAEPGRIVSLDPWGHRVASVFAEEIAAGADIRPTIAVTHARLQRPGLAAAIEAGRLAPDGDILRADGEVQCLRVVIEPVWWLPGVAQRLGLPESALRRALFEQGGGMYPELVTRPDLKVFLPPIGGLTLSLFGDASRLGTPETRVACELHDASRDADGRAAGHGPCRPDLGQGLAMCIEMAQQGGIGLVIDAPCGECVAQAPDRCFPALMPDVLHWLGIRRLDRWISAPPGGQEILLAQGIEVGQCVSACAAPAGRAACGLSRATPDADGPDLPRDRALES